MSTSHWEHSGSNTIRVTLSLKEHAEGRAIGNKSPIEIKIGRRRGVKTHLIPLGSGNCSIAVDVIDSDTTGNVVNLVFYAPYIIVNNASTSDEYGRKPLMLSYFVGKRDSDEVIGPKIDPSSFMTADSSHDVHKSEGSIVGMLFSFKSPTHSKAMLRARNSATEDWATDMSEALDLNAVGVGKVVKLNRKEGASLYPFAHELLGFPSLIHAMFDVTHF